MRYISEQFKEKQNQLIRPPLKMRFEVCSDIINRVIVNAYQYYVFFDTTVAPFVFPKHNINEYYYAVVGDGIGVDDSTRMCAPDNSGVIAEPEHSVPMGVSTVVAVNTEVMFGSNTFYENPIGFPTKSTFSFKGGLIPEVIRVEVYDVQSGVWSVEQTIYNTDLSEEFEYLCPPGQARYHRFYLKNTTKGGRYQLNWIRRDVSLPQVVFENNYISSVMIDEGTDLTSQAEPNYDLTVTCLDVNGEYEPDTEYWDKNQQFTDGKTCVLSVGYKNDEGEVELVPMLVGYLTQKPTYDQGKISFRLSAWKKTTKSRLNFQSLPNASLNVGDEVDSHRLSSFFGNVFNHTEIFADSTDDQNSISNFYGYFEKGNIAKLMANALGGYITVTPDSTNLYNTCNIQYKKPVDYVTRYEQVKATLESQPKVYSTRIERNFNTLSSNYVDVEANTRVSISANGSATTRYYMSFYAFGKIVAVDYQSSVPSATLTITGSTTEIINANGTITVLVTIRSNVATTVKPILRFYGVETTQFEEYESISSDGSEDYVNENELVTNTYLADKVRRVAKFMSDVSNQYEIDVVQDIRYELGDVIRLETQKNVFKTCVITGLKFNFPGSNGHITCRKIFNLADSTSAIYGVDNCYLAEQSGTPKLKITGTDNGYVAVGKLIYNNKPYLFVLGATGMTYSGGFSVTTITDDNSHAWTVRNLNAQGMTYSIPVIDLGNYDSTKESDYKVYGAKTLLMKLYAEQDMTAPISYTNP